MTTSVIYSFNKTGAEADYWMREIAASSRGDFRMIPFNHQAYLDPQLYVRAQLLDNLYFKGHPGLLAMYRDLERVLRQESAAALIVDNCHAYHPEFLRRLPIYKVLRINDGPISAYDRDFAYAHAYDLVLYHSLAYSRELEMPEKLDYLRVPDHALWPLGAFDAMADPAMSEGEVLGTTRDIEIVFVGALHFDKMPLLARMKKRYGRRLVLRGLANWKRNLYFNAKFGFPGFVTPIEIEEFRPLYLRSKIGINLHNRGEFTFGNYRLFDLPCNGVAQVCDGGNRASRFFEPGVEILSSATENEMIANIDRLLADDELRQRIAAAGYRRANAEHRMRNRFDELVRILAGRLEAP